MNLLRSHILGFGKLSGEKIVFDSGLNVLWAPNEAGKSTLQRFLVGMLYGPIRTDIKAQRRFDAWTELYRPWRGADYGGILWCSLANGRKLEILRTFDRDNSRLEIKASTGEDITRHYETRRNGDVVFAAAHLGLAKELYESVAVIRETETTGLGNPEALRDRIANLAQSGDEKLSFHLSLAKIEQALESIGSDRAPTKPYKQALDRLQELQDERLALENRRSECAAWIQQKQELGNEIEQLEEDLRAAGRGVLAARCRETRLRVRNLEEIDREIRNMTSEMESLGADPDFPVGRLDELNRFAADYENAGRRLKELRARTAEAVARRVQAEAEIHKLSAYAGLHTTTEPEKITEWFVSYLSLSRQKDDVQRTMNRLAEEAAGFRKDLESLGPVLQDPDVDWERKARLIAEQERSASEQSAAAAEKVAGRRSEHGRLAGRARRWGGLTVLAALGAIASATAAAGWIMPGFVDWTATVALVGLGAVLLSVTLRSRKAAGDAKRRLDDLESELRRLREQADAAKSELVATAADSGFAGLEEFLAAARNAVLKRQRLADLGRHIREAEQERNRLQTEAEGVYGCLKECLAQVGLSCAPGNLRAQVDTLRAHMRRYAELEASRRGISLEIEALECDGRSASLNVEQLSARMQEVLAEGKVDSLEAFRQGVQNCRRLLEMRAKVAARVRELERLRGTLILSQWQDRLRELEGACGPEMEGARENAPSPSYLPYLPTAEEAEVEDRRISASLAAKREEYAHCVERVRQAFHNLRDPAEIEEDLAIAEREVQELTLNRNALARALEEIQALAREQQEVCAPQLNRTVEERFLRICPERYEEVRIGPDFKIQVREKATGELRPAESLSRGTQDQLYFSVRFGILELLGNPQEPAPCLLDEPFVAYDRERMAAAFALLKLEAATRQLFLFTCRDEVRTQALLHGAHLITLNLS